jgi:hypothetical protein
MRWRNGKRTRYEHSVGLAVGQKSQHPSLQTATQNKTRKLDNLKLAAWRMTKMVDGKQMTAPIDIETLPPGEYQLVE